MSAARHARPAEVEKLSLEEIADRYVARYGDRTPDWEAFEDAKTEGYKRAQMRFIGGGGSGKHEDTKAIPARGFTLSIMFVNPGQGNAAHTHEVEEVFFVLQGFLDVFLEDDAGRRIFRRLGRWETISCPPGVIHGYINQSLEPVYFQVMLGRARPEAMGYSDQELYERREAHLKSAKRGVHSAARPRVCRRQRAWATHGMNSTSTGSFVKHTDYLSSFIDGRMVAIGDQGRRLVRPWDGGAIGSLLEAGEEGVVAATVSGKRALREFGRSSLHRRIELLSSAADALERSGSEIADLVSSDIGKPIRIARGEVARGVELLRACAAVASQSSGETVPVDAAASGAGCIGIVRKIPYGVVAAITPFNAPVNLLLQKVAPAIAAGNVVIAKPAPAGQRTAVRIAEIFMGAGWPGGVLNVLGGDRKTAAALVSHPDVRAVSFTGGTAGGDALARCAGAKKFVSELGSNAANVVCADADLRIAAKKIAAAGFEASGQQCISAQRVLVERPGYDAFISEFIAAAKSLKVGPPDDITTDIGPMIDEAAALRAATMFEEACTGGAKAVLSPRRERALLSPGIVVDVPRESRLWREEVFGPIVLVAPFDTVDDALELANDSEFGLQGALFTTNLSVVMRFLREFDVGSLWVNESSRFRLDMYPFGGVKNSGVGREGLRYAMDELSQLKFIGIKA